MISRVLLVSLLVACVSAQRWVVRTNPQTANCPPGQSIVTKNDYKGGALSVCAYNYEDVCEGAAGPTVCNRYDGVCLQSKIKYPSSFPASQFVTVRPSECVSAGAYWHPETAVLAAAEPPISFVILLASAIITIYSTRSRVSRLALIMFGLIFFTSTLLLVSYYYLTAFLAVMVSCIALTCFATRDNNIVAAGMFSIFFVLLFFTWGSGLGGATHQGRLTAGNENTKTPFMESWCTNYYRGYFTVDRSTSFEGSDPQVITYGYCNRNWLAAEYFFDIFIKIELVLLLTVGARVMRSREVPAEEHKQA